MEIGENGSSSSRFIKFPVYPFGPETSLVSREVVVDGLESTQIICLICTTVVSKATSKSVSTQSLKTLIAEITLINPIYLHIDQYHIGFCESCQRQVLQLQDIYNKFVQVREELVLLSTNLTLLVAQNNNRFLGNQENEEHVINNSFHKEWNAQRVRQMVQNKIFDGKQITNASTNDASQRNEPNTVDSRTDDSTLVLNITPSHSASNLCNITNGSSCRSTPNIIETTTRTDALLDDESNLNEEPPSDMLNMDCVTDNQEKSVDEESIASSSPMIDVDSGNKRFPCDKCDKVFTRGYSLRLHARSHSGDESSLKCDKCDRKFTSVTTLEVHQKTHKEKNLLHCPICKKTLKQKRALDAHLHRHYVTDFKVSRVNCDICQKPFDSPLLLMQHMNVHTGGDFQCGVETCKRAFKTCFLLEEHGKLHKENSDGPSSSPFYDCDYCMDIFENEKARSKHVETHMASKAVLCHECGRCFPSKSLLQNHLRVHKNVAHKCEVCGKNFCSASNLKNHKKLHTGERPFNCTYCKQSFAQKASLNLHMRKHSGVNPFLCNYCKSSGFTYKQAYRQHLATKHPEIYLEAKKFLCNVCWKNFNTAAELTEHEVIHDKHKCKLCNRQFKMLIHLKEHLLSHASLKPHKCMFCTNKAFLRRKNLIDHIRKMHPGEDAETAADAENPQDHVVAQIGQREETKKKEQDVEMSKLLDKIKANNNAQWKHVRQFVRNILLTELEQEKWTRKSTEDLNARLAKQNNYLRSKLQEKRNERLKLDDEIEGLRNKYRTKARAIEWRNQHFVATRCQDTFEKLTKLHQEVETIQKELINELEKNSSDAESPRPPPTFQRKHEQAVAIFELKSYQPDPSSHEKSYNYNSIARDNNDGKLQKLVFPSFVNDAMVEGGQQQQPNVYNECAAKVKVLNEYYPLMLESRSVIEKLLTRIAVRINHLIELTNESNNLLDSIHVRKSRDYFSEEGEVEDKKSETNTFPRRKKTKTRFHRNSKQHDSSNAQCENLVDLFSKDYEKLQKVLR